MRFTLRLHLTTLVALALTGCSSDVVDVDRCPIGAEPAVVAATFQGELSSLVFDEDSLFFTLKLGPEAKTATPYSIWRIPRSGGFAERIVEAKTRENFAVSREHLYWFEPGSTGAGWVLMRAPKAGGEPEVLDAKEAEGILLYSNGDQIYRISSKAIDRLTAAGSFENLVTFDTEIEQPALDGDAIYIMAFNAAESAYDLRRVDGETGATEVLVKAAKPLGPHDDVTIATDTDAMTVDDTYVYWKQRTSTGHVIRRVPKRGGADEPVVYIRSQTSEELAVLGGRVYWVEQRMGNPLGERIRQSLVRSASMGKPPEAATTLVSGRVTIEPLLHLLRAATPDGSGLYYVAEEYDFEDPRDLLASRIIKTCR